MTQGIDAGYFVNGKLINSNDKPRFEMINPATGKVIGTAIRGGKNEIDEAVRSARQAFKTWKEIPPNQKTKLMLTLADLIEKNGPELAKLDTLNMGRPISDSEYDTNSVINLIRYFAGATDKLRGATIPVGQNSQALTLREPYGVIGAIIPWNYPLFNACLKISPILAAGNTVVLKPAEESPMSAVRLGELCSEAGFPPGVVNVVTGFGEEAGAALASHMEVNKISFTGSTDTGRLIMKAAAESNLKPVMLELGGKSPNIIFPDANIDAALDAATLSVFFNQGQTCTAATRLLVHDSIANEVIRGLSERLAKIRIGDPMDRGTNIGPLVSKTQFEKVKKYVQMGVSSEAKKVAEGAMPDDPSLKNGYFVSPVVFDNVDQRTKIAQEEIFGPVLSIIHFSSEEEAIKLANATTYGLAASVWTGDVYKAHRVASLIESGLIWVNTMFAESAAVPVGGYKMSGFGREYGLEAMEEYTRLKSIWFDLTGTFNKWV